ncbi:MAG TPA: spore coat protein U domain-containing protein [Nitrospirota bacterium]|nr:spore coat protein U domain-containing protein [Nitrospirota bacterium]
MNKVISLASVVVVVALIILAMGRVASASGTSTLTVTATVLGECQFITTASTLAFTLDPSSAANATATASPTFWCTLGTTVTTPVAYNQGLNYSGGSNRMKSTSNPTQFIPYTLALTPSGTTGLGRSNPLTLTVTGTVLNANYINAMAANDYTDTVTITIAP